MRHGRTDGRTGGRTEWNHYTPTTSLCVCVCVCVWGGGGGYNNKYLYQYSKLSWSKESWTSCRVHYDDVIMTMLASQITSLPVVCSIVYSGVNRRKHQSSASLAFVREIHRGPVNFPHKWPVTRKMFPFDDVIMYVLLVCYIHSKYISAGVQRCNRKENNRKWHNQ